jgi:hypothetical protein
MKRIALTVFAALLAALALTGCQRMIEVESGTRVTCTYGHEISDDVELVKVAAKGSGAYRIRTETRTCERHLALERLYDEAQDLIAKGDLKAAAKKLAAINADDPAFRRAKEQADAIAAGKKPASDRTPPRTPSPTAPKPDVGEGDTSGPVGSLLKFVPDPLEGYVAQRPSTDAFSISRNYTPSSGDDVQLLVIYAEQARTAADAKRILDSTMAKVTPQSASTEQIKGRTVRFGDDGRGSTFAGFTTGSVVVALEMVAKAGVDPSKNRSKAVTVMKALP